MDLALKGKRALVTGSTTGIGEAIIRRLAGEAPIGYTDGRKAVGQDHQHSKHDWIYAQCEHGCVRRNQGSDAQSYCGTIPGSWNARSNCKRDQPWSDQECQHRTLAADDGGGSWVAIRTCAT